MSMIFHLIECLNQLGFKIKIESIVGAHEKIDHSFLLSGVDLDKVLKDKNYVSKLKEDLYKKYFERRYEMVNCKVDSFLCFIWEQVGIEIFADSLYPFRNAMIKEFLSEQNLIYDEVIEQFCKYLNIARENQSHISLFYIKLMMLPSMFLRAASMVHGGKGSSKCTDSDKLLMKQLSVRIKIGADKMNKEEKHLKNKKKP